MGYVEVRRLLAGIFLVLVALLVVGWVFHGTTCAVLRVVWASTMIKFLIVVVLVACVVAAVTVLRDVELAPRAGGWWLVAGLLVVVVAPVLGVWGGYHRAQQLSESITVTDAEQTAYEWRTPWAVASSAVTSRAGSVVGTFEEDATTFLPATGAYVTPVRKRGWVTGFDQIVVQAADETTVSVCDFDAQVPVEKGWFQYNLKRAVSFVGAGLMADPDDVWAYCDGDQGVMVVPVTRYTGFPEQHQVPAGVVLFDGHRAVLDKDVEAGELPGPVYPMSLAAKQRESSHALTGLVDRMFRRSGYEQVGSADGTDAGNESELLLRRSDGSGWDFVSALTPRGSSASVVAVSAIEADEVHDGTLNPMTVHRLPQARQGNAALSNAIIAAFPQLNWDANQLTLKEVIPTSSSSWTASITKSTTVTRLVTIDAQGAMCLTEVDGTELDCVDADGVSTGSDEDTDTDTDSVGDLSSLSDEELADLQQRVAAEVAERLGSGDR